MNQRVLLFITLPLLLVTIAFFVVNHIAAQKSADEQRTIAASSNESGKQFLLEGKPVEVTLDGASEHIQVGDSQAPTLRLRSKSISDTHLLGNEHGGTLVASLSLTGCQVNSEQADPKETSELIDAFVWHWGVLCTNAGTQDLEVTLKFRSDSGESLGSDPIAYRYSQQVRVSEPWSLEQISKVVGILGTALTVITGAAGLFGNKRKTAAAS